MIFCLYLVCNRDYWLEIGVCGGESLAFSVLLRTTSEQKVIGNCFFLHQQSLRIHWRPFFRWEVYFYNLCRACLNCKRIILFRGMDFWWIIRGCFIFMFYFIVIVKHHTFINYNYFFQSPLPPISSNVSLCK